MGSHILFNDPILDQLLDETNFLDGLSFAAALQRISTCLKNQSRLNVDQELAHNILHKKTVGLIKNIRILNISQNFQYLDVNIITDRPKRGGF